MSNTITNVLPKLLAQGLRALRENAILKFLGQQEKTLTRLLMDVRILILIQATSDNF